MKELYADFYENKGKPLVVVIGSITPGIPKISKKLSKYLKSNYSLLLLAYFGVGDLPKKLERLPLEYFINAINYFKEKLGLLEKDIIFIGSNKGAELVLLLSSKYLNPGIVVACEPSCYVWQSIPNGFKSMLFPKSSWSYNKKDIPYVKYKYNSKILNDIKHHAFISSYLYSIEKNKNKYATININQYQGKVLLLSSEKDYYWPSKAMCEFISKMRTENTEYYVINCNGDQLLEYEESSQRIINFLNRMKNH